MIMRQPQSVAALAFIAVLIALLLILTVMVHMRNRKLKRTLEEQMAERRILDKICADFTAVYYVELNTGSFEILHINDGTNVKKMNLKQGDNFNSSADQYAVQYLYGKERQEFKDRGFDGASEGTAFLEGAHYLPLQKQTESEPA